MDNNCKTGWDQMSRTNGKAGICTVYKHRLESVDVWFRKVEKVNVDISWDRQIFSSGGQKAQIPLVSIEMCFRTVERATRESTDILESTQVRFRRVERWKKRVNPQFGHIHLCLKELFIEKYGMAKWQELMRVSDSDELEDFMLFHHYNDEKTMQLITASCQVLGTTVESFLEEYGHYFYFYAAKRGYDRMMSTLGRDFATFVQNLDKLHSLLANTYKGMQPPSFRCESIDGQLRIHIFTVREGTYPIAIGLLTECAKQLFQTEINIVVVEKKKATNLKYNDHVITDVNTLSAQGLGTVPRSSSVATSDLTKASSEYLQLNRLDLQESIPFGIIFDSEMRILTAGMHVLSMCPELLRNCLKMDEVFELVEPRIDFNYKTILKSHINSFYLQFKKLDSDISNGKKSNGKFVLKGQMIPVKGKPEVVFVCGPHFESLDEMSSCNKYFDTIPQDRFTTEIMFMYNQRKADMEVSKKLDETTARLQKMATSLEEEKKKTDKLLYQMLPVKVANQLRNGNRVEAEKYESATILFSDIVSFTNMAAKTEPMSVVHVLNDLFRRFDALTNKHNVYKVETIGDAYMIVAGVPEVSSTHAQNVANMAIDMIKETEKVLHPVSKTPIQIRIGVHTGPVVSGVVGDKMPRFCLFGDTVNTASRMESNGFPGRIHISEAVNQELQDTHFLMRPRGQVSIKGKGLMRTYFLIGCNNQRIHGLYEEDKTSICVIL